MSRIGKVTEDIMQHGREKRGTWQPRVDGAPLRSYLWWRKETGNYRSMENFCHFWRVVLIWAPLLRLRRLVTQGRLRKTDCEQLVIGLSLLLIVALMILNLAWGMWPAFGAWAILAAPAAFAGALAAFYGLIVAADKIVEAVKSYRRKKRLNAPTPVVTKEDVSRSPKQRHVGPAIERVLVRVGKPISRILVTVWEYLVLIAQAVRVKKWRICPIVEIPAETT